MQAQPQGAAQVPQAGQVAAIAAPAAQAAPAAPAPRAIFALAPGLTENGVLDYSTPAGAKIYRAATLRLQEDSFSCEPQGLKVFLAALADRSMVNGWEPILDIPADALAPNANLRNLIQQFGQITLQEVRNHAALYTQQEQRAAQDSMQLYQCLMASITKEAKAKVMIWRDEYMVLGTPSGACLLKIIIRESHIDTRATVRHIRDKLSSLDTYLPTIGFDIMKFNTYVRDLLDSLYARGETTQDLLANLFKAYKVAKDKTFVDYIRKKEDQYDEGENVDVDMLMQQAANKYKTMVQQGTWAAPSSEEEKIIALETKIKNLQKGSKTKAKGKGQGGKAKGKKSSKNQKRDKPDWMTKAPSPQDMNKSKKVDEKVYWWCKTHKSWGRHKNAECKGLGLSTQEIKQQSTAPHTAIDESVKQRLKLSKALETVMEEEDE